ncbi:MAG TPA: ATP-binding protein [Opitutaceae bacterium]|nr:ATP-binding protein [Opitutaceae bacterium]
MCAQDSPPSPEPEVSGETLPVLRDYQTFWGLADSARQQRHRVEYEAVVLYYDADWQIIWLENNGVPFFLRLGSTRWPIATGDRVLVQGTVFPPHGYELDGLRLTKIGDAQLPAPLVFDPRAEPGWYNERRTRVRGVVEDTTEPDGRHVQLVLISDGTPITVIAHSSDAEPVQRLDGMMVEVVGMFTVRRDPSGRVASIDLWVDGLRQLAIVGSLATEARFAAEPLTSLQLLERRPRGAVRFDGRVRKVQPGQSVTLWDESGEVLVESAQRAPVKEGDLLQAVGDPEIRGTAIVLKHALWRVANAPPPAEVRLKLRRAVQVLELAPEEAARGHPVEVVGVVTWSHPDASFFYIQDSTRGVCIRCSGRWLREPPRLGGSVRVFGRTTMGQFAPAVEFERYEEVSGYQLPEPREVAVDQVRGGAEEGKLVELHGYLRTVRRDGAWSFLSLTSPSGEFVARMPKTDGLERMIGAVLSVRGVCTAVANDRRQLVGIELLVAGASSLTVSEAAPADPFSAPTTRLSGLRRFSPLQTPYRRIRTAGRVTYHEPGRLLLLEEGDDGLEVLARGQERLPIGAMVEVVGFPGLECGNPVLREAVFRRVADEGVARPPLPVVAELRPDLHNRLVRLDGRLVGQVQLVDARQLTLRAENVTFTAVAPATLQLERLPPESAVRVIGVYRAIFDEYGQQRDFQLLLRESADLVVIETPSWLTRGRLLALASLLAVGAVAAVSWNVLLRRRVHAQTLQIRRQLEQQGALERELQKAAKLESLGLLAGGIAHDFNNLLTVILGNLTLARLDPTVEAAAGDCLDDAERGAQRARDLTQQLLTFAKGGDPHRTAVSLPEIVREAAELVVRGTKVSCDFDFAYGVWPAEADRGQIGQVVHNLVLNALQAMPEGGAVRLSLENVEIGVGAVMPLAPGRYLKLAVADTGPGMSAEVRARIFDPYFTTKKAGSGLGLATVHSIVRKHKGYIDVVSMEGRGTTFHVWLPASASMVVAAQAAPVSLPVVVAGKRVLVMDDEPEIRRLVTTLLHRMGLEVVAVGDGAEAVEAFRAARAAGNPFDLVITDLTVPGGMGGKDAMQALLALDPEVRAIVSSGYSNDPVLADYRASGFRGMVRKPYEIEELATCVAQVLSGVEG